MLCNSIANQGSIYHWARDHRVHHKYSETDADPHNAMRGFFFAHMGWLYVKKHPEVVRAGKELDFSDLHEDPVVMFQKKLDPWFALYMCFVFPAQIAVKFWGERFWTAFFVAGALRYMLVLHFTWLVNSAAHLYGDHPYDVVSYPSENPYVSFFAVGEGWHNWHHKYPFDYGERELSTCYYRLCFLFDSPDCIVHFVRLSHSFLQFSCLSLHNQIIIQTNIIIIFARSCIGIRHLLSIQS